LGFWGCFVLVERRWSIFGEDSSMEVEVEAGVFGLFGGRGRGSINDVNGSCEVVNGVPVP
jgi:hypothetical protein